MEWNLKVGKKFGNLGNIWKLLNRNLGNKLGIRKNLKSLKKIGNSIVICKLEIDNRKLEIRYFDKI